MSSAKEVYALIAKGHARSLDAIVLATGHPPAKVRAALDWLIRGGLIQRGEQFRPAMYSAVLDREAPRPVGRRRGGGQALSTAKLLAAQPPLAMAWGRVA